MSNRKPLLFICLGTTLIALAITYLIIPHHIIEGGVLGIALLLNYLYDLPIGISIAAAGVPIYIVAWLYNRSLLLYNLLGAAALAAMLELLRHAPLPGSLSPLPSAIIGGLLIGTGVGLMLTRQISTDGIDLLAHLLHKIFGINVGIVIFALDVVIIGCGLLFMDSRQFILSLITVCGISIMTMTMTARRTGAGKRSIS